MILSIEHKERFLAIKNQLSQLGNRESVFVRIELMFFEVLQIAHTYGDASNTVLFSLKQLEREQYAACTAAFHKASQKEKAILKFTTELKNILRRAATKKMLVS